MSTILLIAVGSVTWRLLRFTVQLWRETNGGLL